ncbi:HypC/HybG/HupF family hydrogenase formation chaperone [Oryzibacter oryziterrae]|uniref:HypC/HybG/HupF family hydrogenase formation chaperone n=1 Tax=Oryzibacter oryziterrae TaxID=2766474 RepID=UPI001F29A2A9|nr:HypC/HybG/HupF family hydrogenase formation chaperone [Oryzibacter oryziterrae]
MCIAIPMMISEIGPTQAIGSARGARREIDLALVEAVEVGDWVLVHLGRALRKTTATEAEELWALFDQMSG